MSSTFFKCFAQQMLQDVGIIFSKFLKHLDFVPTFSRNDLRLLAILVTKRHHNDQNMTSIDIMKIVQHFWDLRRLATNKWRQRVFWSSKFFIIFFGGNRFLLNFRITFLKIFERFAPPLLRHRNNFTSEDTYQFPCNMYAQKVKALNPTVSEKTKRKVLQNVSIYRFEESLSIEFVQAFLFTNWINREWKLKQ